jgi:hypothetical protein
MNHGSLEDLLSRARKAPRVVSDEPPPFFSQRVTARWLSAQREGERTAPWEIFALRGAALSAAAMILALGFSVSLLPGNNDDTDLDATAEIFSLP